MRSLIWKDIVVAKWLLAAAIPVYVGQLMAMADAPPMFALLTLLGAVFFAVVSVGVEETQRTETLWNSLPVSRSLIVYARYLTTLLGIGFALGASWIIGLAMAGWFQPDAGAAGPLGPRAYLTLACVLLLFAALFLPCYFRFGAGTGVQVFSALSLGLMILLSVAGSLVVLANGGAEALAELRDPSPERIEEMRRWLASSADALLAGLTVTTLALTAWSATLSAQFYRSRDL